MPIVNGKYQNPHWVNGGPPALDAAELNAISDTLEKVDSGNGGGNYQQGNGILIDDDTISTRLSTQQGNVATFGPDGGLYVPESSGGGSYTQGNGISISGTEISARISGQSGNQARFGTDGGIYVPTPTSYTLPPATQNTLGGIKVGSGLSVAGDGTLSVSGGSSGDMPFSEKTETGEFNGSTSRSVSIGASDDIFGRAFIAAFVRLNNSGQSAQSNMGCTFGGFTVIESIPVSPGSRQDSCVAIIYQNAA